MLSKLLLVVSLLAPTAVVRGAVTTNLVAYWDFEGTANNHAAAAGGSAFDGVLTGGAVTTGAARAGNGGLGLDGVNGYMNVTSNVAANSAWSVSAWFRTDTVPAGSARASIYESTGGANGFSMSFALRDGTTGTPAGTADQTSLQVFSRYGTTNVNAQTLLDDAVMANTWHHSLTVFTPATATTAGSIIGYIGGVQATVISLPAGAVLEPVSGLRVGTYRNADGRWFDGSIDELAIWDRGLSAGEAAEVFTLGNNGQAIPEPAAPLLAGLALASAFRRRR